MRLKHSVTYVTGVTMISKLMYSLRIIAVTLSLCVGFEECYLTSRCNASEGAARPNM